MRNAVRETAFLFAFGALVLANPSSATAPLNDNWANATVIGSLPFATSETNIVDATLEATDPEPPCLAVLGDPASNSLWYKYTTGSSYEYVTLRAPAPDNWDVTAIIVVYTGTPGAFSIVSGGCSDWTFDLHGTRIAGLRLAPNTTYSVEVAADFPPAPVPPNPATLNFTLDAAQQYLVGKKTDSNRASCSGDCSLREAIAASNANPGAVIIPAGTYTLSLAGANEYLNATGDLDVTQGMGIYGAGIQTTIIDANHIDRALLLDPDRVGNLAFSIGDLTLTNGTAPALAPPESGQRYFGTWGGGLCAPNGNGNNDFVGLERIAVTLSTAAAGGGIELDAPGTIRDSWIANNTATAYYGGGLEVAVDSARRVVISGSTISGNVQSGPAAGGGISALGSVSLVNSTVSGNSSTSSGGGIFFSSSDGGLSIASSTIVWNTAFVGNPFKTDVGGGVMFDGGANSIVNSIIAYNTGGDPSPSYEKDCYLLTGTLAASDNIVQFPDNCPIPPGDAHVDPKVLPLLVNNGGSTPTHYLDATSPARDSGDPAGCKDTDGLPLAYDQRGPGFPRINGPQCDKGAVEWSDIVFQNGFE